MNRTIASILLFPAILNLFCGGMDRPGTTIDIPTFARVYVELVNTEWMRRGGTLSTAAKSLPDSTIARLGVTREQIAATVAYFNEDLERWRDFYKEVVRLQEEQVRKPASP